MKHKTGLFLGIIISLLFIVAGVAFSQETTETAKEAPEPQNESDVQWLWGEVVSVDLQSKSFIVKFTDWETEQEKEVKIDINDKTAFENINSLDEVKPNDTLSVDYIVATDGKNIAKIISLEKPEEQEAPPPNLKPETATEATTQGILEETQPIDDDLEPITAPE
jgi:hypothetical protein